MGSTNHARIEQSMASLATAMAAMALFEQVRRCAAPLTCMRAARGPALHAGCSARPSSHQCMYECSTAESQVFRVCCAAMPALRRAGPRSPLIAHCHGSPLSGTGTVRGSLAPQRLCSARLCCTLAKPPGPHPARSAISRARTARAGQGGGIHGGGRGGARGGRHAGLAGQGDRDVHVHAPVLHARRPGRDEHAGQAGAHL